MKIHRENIEEFMFDYFEGNLSDQERQKVLDFVHENPEFEKDFVLWAKSYAHIGEPAPNYKLTGMLEKKGEIANLNKYYWAISVVALVAISWWWLSFKKELPDTNLNRPKIGSVTNLIKKDSVPFKKTIPNGPLSSIERTINIKLKTATQKQVPKITEGKKELDKDTLFDSLDLRNSNNMEKQNDDMKQNAIEIKPIVELEPYASKNDSIEKLPVKEQFRDDIPAKKKKKPNPLNLNTSPRFIEQNPNF